MSVDEGMVGVLLGIEQATGLLTVLQGQWIVGEIGESGPELDMGLQDEAGILDAVSQAEALLGQRSGRPQLRPNHVKKSKAKEYGEERHPVVR